MGTVYVVLVVGMLSVNAVESAIAPPSVNIQQTINEVFRQTESDHNLSSYDAKTELQPNFFELVSLPRREADVQKDARLAELSLDVINRLHVKLNKPAKDILNSSEWHTELSRKFREYCPERVSNITCEADSSFRTVDGSCNNLAHPTWGMAGGTQLRMLPPAYEDGLEAPRVTSKFGDPLPSPRSISNVVHKAGKVPQVHKRLSAMMMTWGQFLMHDITSTPSMRDSNGASLDCCGKDNASHACFPIKIPQPDEMNRGPCMNMVRSSPAVGPSCDIDVRQQMNKVTSYLDGSAIYGSSKEEEREIRAWRDGLLRESEFELLPSSGNADCIRKHVTDQCQFAGDERSNVVPSVGALHTLFMREHNRIAKKLKEVNRDWQDERIYQETRKIVSAVIQHITYNEYLPIVLGHNMTAHYGLIDLGFGHNHVYRDDINAGITNSFAAAAFRFGHSTVPSKQTYIGPKFEKKRGVNIEETYHRPYYLLRYKNFGYEGLMRWLITDPVPNIDRRLETGVRNNLFKQGNVSFDLAAINIQRGRDHGIPSYNAWRKWCGLLVAESFTAGKFGLVDHDQETADLLRLVYRHPDDIDLYTGGLSERHVKGGNVGPTFACIIGRQFHTLKFGDRFWYENLNFNSGFTQGQLDSIKTIQLAKIICSNLDIPDIQRNAFYRPMINTHFRRHILCDQLPDLEYYAWSNTKPDWLKGKILTKNTKVKTALKPELSKDKNLTQNTEVKTALKPELSKDKNLVQNKEVKTALKPEVPKGKILTKSTGVKKAA